MTPAVRKAPPPRDPAESLARLAGLVTNTRALLAGALFFVTLFGATAFNFAVAWNRQLGLPAEVSQLRVQQDTIHQRMQLYTDSSVATLRHQVETNTRQIAIGQEVDRFLSCVASEQLDGRDASGCRRWLGDPTRYRPPGVAER